MEYLQEEQLWLQEQQELKALVLEQMVSFPLKEIIIEDAKIMTKITMWSVETPERTNNSQPVKLKQT